LQAMLSCLAFSGFLSYFLLHMGSVSMTSSVVLRPWCLLGTCFGLANSRVQRSTFLPDWYGIPPCAVGIANITLLIRPNTVRTGPLTTAHPTPSTLQNFPRITISYPVISTYYTDVEVVEEGSLLVMTASTFVVLEISRRTQHMPMFLSDSVSSTALRCISIPAIHSN
jgi:hypothetical protein